MNTRWRAASAVGVAVAVSVAVLAEQAGAPQVFRTGVDSVEVDVTVRQGRSPVKGLRSEDFELLDNGVKQAIEAISIEEVPVDLTLILDASGSTTSVIDRFKERAAQIAEMLRPRDRVRLIAFSGEVTEILPLTAAGGRLPVDGLTARGGTSLHDALLLSLARTAATRYRQLVVVFSDGIDTTSVVDASTLASIAVRADCVLHVVLSGYPGTLPVTARSLQSAAEGTGGALHDPGEYVDAVDAFRRVFEDFRQSYVLRYTLAGVPPRGWHAIAVRVIQSRGGRYTIRARKGYFGG